MINLTELQKEIIKMEHLMLSLDLPEYLDIEINRILSDRNRGLITDEEYLSRLCCSVTKYYTH